MRGSRFLGLIILSGLLSGCGFMDWISEDPDNLKFAAMVREEVERVEAERGKTRRDYIDQRIDKKIGSVGQNDAEFSKLEEKIAALGTRLDVVSRRAGTPELALSVDRPAGPTTEEFEALRGETRAAIRAVAGLIDEAEQRDASANARFERLEYRTRTVDWPVQGPGTGPGLHLASYKSHESALRGWEVLLKKYPSVLAGQEPALTEINTVAGRFVRLIVGGGLPETSLIRIRNQIRSGGDYAMIMPVPLSSGRAQRSTSGNKRAPDS
jgi:hypothetical protein